MSKIAPRQVPQASSPAVAEIPTAPSFGAMVSGKYLKVTDPPMWGPSVTTLKKHLASLGYKDIPEGNTYDARFAAVVEKFQKDRGCKVDGIVGPETFGALYGPQAVAIERRIHKDGIDPDQAARTERLVPLQASAMKPNVPTISGHRLAAGKIDPSTISTSAVEVSKAPDGMSQAQKYAFYADMVRANGGKLPSETGRPTVVALRGVSIGGEAHDTTSATRYDDMFAVLTMDGRVVELAGATHPGQKSSLLSPDVTGDGAGDVGMIAAGNFVAHPNGIHGQMESFHVRTEEGGGKLKGYRDTNHDGVFDANERATSALNNDTLDQVLVHHGADDRPVSIGCLTLNKTEYQKLLDAVGNGRTPFNLTLLSKTG